MRLPVNFEAINLLSPKTTRGKGPFLAFLDSLKNCCTKLSNLIPFGSVFSLFDRKFRVFEATLNFLKEVLRDQRVGNDCLHTFLAETKGARFIFGEEIPDYLNELYKKSMALRGHIRRKDIEKENETLNWLEQQIVGLDKVFEKHISIEK